MRKINKTRLIGIIKETLKKQLNEGAGAGYDVCITGLTASQVVIGEKETTGNDVIVPFNATIAPSIVEWKSSSYYDSVSSEGIYHDGELVDEFDDEQRKVLGGSIKGFVYLDDVLDYSNGYGENEVTEVQNYITDKLTDFSFKANYGGGWTHSDLGNPMVFDDVELTSTNSYYSGGETVVFNQIIINAPEITQIINWFYENCYRFDEIYGSHGYDEEQTAINEEGKKDRDFLEDVPSQKTYGYEKKGGKYYCYVNGVRTQISKDSYKSGKLSEQLRPIVKESLKELDWKTYANAAKKAQAWRDENPFIYDRNRGLAFDRAAQDAFKKQHGIETEPEYGGERGNINFTSFHGEPELTGSREHNFGDGGGPFELNHHVYHMGKKYGKNGGYGRTRMWDHPHETTPEEFFDSDEMGQQYRDAERDVDAYKNGDYKYSDEEGWHLNENTLKNVIRKSIKRVLNESERDIDDDTYYGGGLPEPNQHANVYSSEPEILKAYKGMEPYIDEISNICNNSDCTMPGIDDRMFQILNAFDEIPRLAKYYQTIELPEQ